MDAVLVAEKAQFHNQPYSLKIKVPPMATLVLKIKEIKKENTEKVIVVEEDEK